MAFLELKKYRETSKDSIRKPWLEFFGNKPFTQEPERAISQADQLLDYKNWSEEDRKMFSQLRMREEQALLAQDYALETARARGYRRGIKSRFSKSRSTRSSDFRDSKPAIGYDRCWVWGFTVSSIFHLI